MLTQRLCACWRAKVIECIEAVSSKDPAPQDQTAQLIASLKSKLDDKDFRNLLEIVPDPLELYRVVG